LQLPQRPEQKSFGKGDRNHEQVTKINFRHGRVSFHWFSAVRQGDVRPLWEAGPFSVEICGGKNSVFNL
jgi:hypothetical protein